MLNIYCIARPYETPSFTTWTKCRVSHFFQQVAHQFIDSLEKLKYSALHSLHKISFLIILIIFTLTLRLESG